MRSANIICFCVIFSGYTVRADLNNTTVRYDRKDENVIVRDCITPNRDTGYCIDINQCSMLLKQRNNTEAQVFLNESICEMPKKNILNSDPTTKVCCGKYDNFVIVKENILFPKTCGRQNVVMGPRILGGEEARLGEFPWLVRLRYKNENGQRVYSCAGFLINNRHVITAAHCVHNQNLISVTLGDHNTEANSTCLPDGKNCVQKHMRKVFKVTKHPNYKHENANHENDIAVIQMKSGARRSKFVQPICVFKDTTESSAKYYLSGWGRTEKKIASDIKMKVELPSFDYEKCTEKYSVLNIRLSDSQMCAGGVAGKDTCRGDSGGPLMMVSSNETWYASGIVSFGIDCGMKGWPGVYTNIRYYISWIRDEMTKNMLALKRTNGRHKKRKLV